MHSPLLDGIRVLDLGAHPASALASMVLADFGATVTCVVPSGAALDRHPARPMLLRGKRVLPQAAGHDYARALAEADAVLTTLAPGDAAPALDPRQIHLNISGWGMEGPYARYPMCEPLVAAKSGRMALFEGQAARPGPVYAAVQIATHAAAQLGVQGVLAALRVRERTGRGDRIETSLLQGFLPYDFAGLTRAELEPRYPVDIPPEPAAAKPTILGYEPGEGSDGRWLQPGNLFDHLFFDYIAVLGATEVVPVADRGKPSSGWSEETKRIVKEGLHRCLRARTSAEWLAAFDANGNVAATRYQTTQDALDDPDLTKPGNVLDAQVPGLGPVRWLGPVAHLENTPARIRVGPADTADPAATAPLTAATPPVATKPLVSARPPDSSMSSTVPRGGANRLPLDGVTVLEFASVIATPLGLSMLTELGARVIKVEPIGGDPGRHAGGRIVAGLLALKCNAGKESIAVELKSPHGREVLDRLLAKADVIAHNFRPGVPEKLGFGWERAKTFNPKLVWLSANGYHPAAPHAARACTHPIAGAQCGGALYQAGSGMPIGSTDDVEALIECGRRLSRANEANPDPSTSVVIASAVLLGLAAAERQGFGQRVNVDMMLANLYANFDDALRYPGKPTRASVDADVYGLNALHRLYECGSGWVFLQIEGEAELRSLLGLLGLEALADDIRYRDAASRAANDSALAAALGAAFRSGAADDWERRLIAAGVGCVRADGAVPGVFWQRDPHVRANGLVVTQPHARFGELLRHGPVMTFTGSDVHCGSPCVAGEHSDALLAELGYSSEKVRRFRADGIVWSEPVAA